MTTASLPEGRTAWSDAASEQTTPNPVKVMVTGHRPQHLTPAEQDDVKGLLAAALHRINLKRPDAVLISGMALGVDQWAAEAAFRLGMGVIAAVPFEGQERRWWAAQRERYRYLLGLCQEVHIVGGGSYGPHLFHQRNQWMVDAATVALAVWNGATFGGTWDAVQRIGKADLPCLVLWAGEIRPANRSYMLTKARIGHPDL